jgi:beta-lactamase regulating signal transducer with metallopeptidase domain/uncharacterized membrane protein YkoI
MKKTSPFIFISRNVAAIVVVLYLLFLCYRSGQLWLAWRRTRIIARSAYSVELPEHVRAVVDECQTALGVRRFQILCSSSVSVPITVGSLNPLVILPEQLLQEADRNVLTSAIGHELVHVWRRDYLLNLLYELIALPLSFHPATALLRRRIKETRELGCDELVTERLLDATVYARSLVRLAGAAVTVGRPTATITVGIADADILEERVMTILRRPQINVRRKNLLLVAAALVFIVPCAVAAPFALRININPQDAAATPRRSITVEPGTLTTWLKGLGEAVERGDAIAEVKTDKGLIKVEASASGVIERLLVQPGERVPADAVLAVIRAQEPPVGWAISTTQPERRERPAAREGKWEYQGQVYTARVPDGLGVLNLTTQQEPPKEVRTIRERVERMVKEAIEKDPTLSPEEARARAERMLKEVDMQVERARAEREREAQNPEIAERRRLEREMMAKRQAELVKAARIPMQQAIQIANSQYPGTVLESRLVRERDQPCYILAILFDNGTETTTTRVLISALDGSIINAMKQER